MVTTGKEENSEQACVHRWRIASPKGSDERGRLPGVQGGAGVFEQRSNRTVVALTR